MNKRFERQASLEKIEEPKLEHKAVTFIGKELPCSYVDQRSKSVLNLQPMLKFNKTKAVRKVNKASL